MRAWPETAAVLGFLARARRMRRAQAILAAVGPAALVAAAITAGVLLSGGDQRSAALGAAFGALGVLTIAHVRFDRSMPAVAAAVEGAASTCRNLLVTAEALVRDPGPTPAAVCRVVIHDAADVVARLRAADLFPLMPAAIRAGLACSLLAGAFLLDADVLERLVPVTAEASAVPVIGDVRITVHAPAYSGLPETALVNPDRVVALRGSRLAVWVDGRADDVRLETAAAATVAPRGTDGLFGGEVALEADGFLALTPRTGGVEGARRLVVLSATPDHPPVPRVVTPGRDLFLREAADSLDVAVEAADDLGLRSLRLAYTKVAGVGESFTFTEGEVPLALTRTSARQWSGRGVLPLASLGLEVGDMVVYRAVAADARPDGRPVESDAFIIEIVSASEAMAEGFSIDDTQDKYALSQQMVILKTERLIARTRTRPAPDADVVLEEAMTIAAEQRSVRAELVFMTGGHFEDEFEEAEHEHEIAAGRLDNTGRADLGRAIRDMARAAAELTDGNLLPALEAEQAALEAMQRALSRRRFILRTLTQREAIDDTRRLTGTLVDARRWQRPTGRAEIDPLLAGLRAALADLAPLAGADRPGPETAAALTRVTERLLALPAVDPRLAEQAARLSRATTAVEEGRREEAVRLIGDVSVVLGDLLNGLVPASPPVDGIDAARLRGAMASAPARGGGR